MIGDVSLEKRNYYHELCGFIGITCRYYAQIGEFSYVYD